MNVEKLYVIHALCESEIFDNLRILIAENVSRIYDVKITNTLNHKYYFLKFIVKTTGENCTRLCEILQENNVILLNCYELVFPSYRVRIKGDAEKCLSIQKELLNAFISCGAIPIKTEITSNDFIIATCDIIVTNKDPSTCVKFLEILRKNKDISYTVTPVESYEC
ncbi:hypothetical protein [Methanothermococcus okinawensis]|uniref:Uncharacterized protein n=1 Tax=Methanothermococcus okinawensis (strain DSM 14208 / JCM 11175 / IH1) TaxID=647113 RepID=F8AJR6_METOI|nr:hypothetical protein [Methanothermococcus okinawensis]AEH07264.1 hypothetical protein Metok_1296 [Methanothermococcus okinawensis IH1]